MLLPVQDVCREPLSPLVQHKNRGAEGDQEDEVPEGERFSLEDGLQRGEIDDQQLTNQGAPNSVEEHAI